MNNSMRDAIRGIVAGMRGEKRAAKGKGILGTLRRGLQLLSGSRAKRLARAQNRLTDELRNLDLQNWLLTKGLSRSPNPNDWSFMQVSGWDALSKAQNRAIASRSDKAVDAAIAALGKRHSARYDALNRVEGLLRDERRAVDEARGVAGRLAATGVATGGAGYGLYKLLGGKGDGEG